MFQTYGHHTSSSGKKNTLAKSTTYTYVFEQLSLGDAHSYILSTAENELGVVIAHSEEGVPMVPVGWQEMQCPKTYVKEFRKVAKVSSEIQSVPPESNKT